MIRRGEAMVPGQPLVELRQVSKRFAMRLEAQRSFQQAFIRFFRRERGAERNFWSLRDVSLDINQGNNVGVIGANGSGKSTLLKLIAGILEPTTGDVVTNGRIASLLELGAGFHPELTGRENVFLNGSVYGLSRRQMAQRVDAIIEFAELGDLIDMPIKHYSSGMYVRLGFAVAIHTDPDLLLVDEVLTVGDASFQHKCLDSIHKFREHGGTLLLVSHNMPVIQSICAQAIWLDRGTVRALGAPADVVTAYLDDVAEREDAASKAQPLPAIERGQRRGTGKIQITEVELRDGNSRPCTVFVEGEPMEIRIRYFAAARVEDPVFGLAVYHQNGLQMCGPNTGLGRYYIPYAEGVGEVVYSIPALSLLEGAYLVSAAVVNRSNTETYDSHDHAYSFRVYPGQSGEFYGLVTLQGRWYLANTKDNPTGATPLAKPQLMP